MKKKNILFMAQLPPPVHGAALRNKSLLESKLINSAFNVISLPLKFIDDMKDLGKFSFGKIFLMIRHALKMTGILLSKKIDLVYFTMSPSGGAFYRDLLFILIIKLFRKKRILHFRVKGIKRTGSTRFGRYLVKYAFRNSEIVCLSQHQLHDLDDLPYNQPYIVPNGIKVEAEFLHLAEEYSYIPGSIPKILFLSNLSHKKGVPELISALKIVRARGYAFCASLVGGEWDLTFENVAKLIREAGLDEVVKIEGPKFGLEKFSFLAKTEIFVFPTYFELFPGVILEAMQFGKAIITTFEGSIPEIIDNGVNGMLVEQQNVHALADAITALLDDPEKRKEMGLKARDKFFNEFTLEAFEQKMQRVFEDVINKK